MFNKTDSYKIIKTIGLLAQAYTIYELHGEDKAINFLGWQHCYNRIPKAVELLESELE